MSQVTVTAILRCEVSVHVLLLFFACTFFALLINTIRAPCPLDPLPIYCKPDLMHGTRRRDA